MSKNAALAALRKSLKSPAGQVAGKTAAIVGGGTAAAYAIPTAAGAGLHNLGGSNEKDGTINRFKGIAVLAALVLIGVIVVAAVKKVIE